MEKTGERNENEEKVNQKEEEGTKGTGNTHAVAKCHDVHFNLTHSQSQRATI
ncbi:unnamed protein product, partial [Candidula unifasciata]